MKRKCPIENIPVKPSGDFIKNVAGETCATYRDSRGINHIEGFSLPNQSEVHDILEELIEIIFPGYSGRKKLELDAMQKVVEQSLHSIYSELSGQITRSHRYNCRVNNCDDCDIPEMSRDATDSLLLKIPKIRDLLKLDVAAAFDGDPAAKSLDEIVLSYPGLKAITIHRISHELYAKNVPLLPRMMSEYAHSQTGIDIHPGAKIGKSFFIDHGTGVVIGETCTIGDNVKIYQGVTLGALSFPKDAEGQIIKGLKRHPSIEDDVTIYAGATILGDISIGKGAVVGGNVWLTEAVQPGTTVFIAKPDLKIKRKSSQSQH